MRPPGGSLRPMATPKASSKTVGRPRATDAPRYPRHIKMYPASEAEHAAMSEHARAHGLSVSAWLRQLALKDMGAK